MPGQRRGNRPASHANVQLRHPPESDRAKHLRLPAQDTESVLQEALRRFRVRCQKPCGKQKHLHARGSH